MSDRICSVEGCERKHSAKDLCVIHYRKLVYYGDPLYIKPEKPKCLVNDCDNTSKTKGFCCAHYHKFLRYNNPNGGLNTESHGMSKTVEYQAWNGLKSRCYNPKYNKYERYGGRGIIVCDRWKNSFINFHEDMGDKPFLWAQIDRKDNNGNYEPGNCRWTTPAINAQNRSTTKLTMDDARNIRTLCKSHKSVELARIYGVEPSVICSIIKGRTWKEDIDTISI